MDNLAIAKTCHEANRAYCEAMGDHSQPAWADAPQWQRDSALAGVAFHQANPDATPEDSHNAWLAVKDADGWVYGEVKDAEAKTHPCMLPYDELPVEQRAKDHIFRAIIHAMTPPPPPPVEPYKVIVLTGFMAHTLNAIKAGLKPFEGWTLETPPHATTADGRRAYVFIANSKADADRFAGLTFDTIIQHMDPHAECVKRAQALQRRPA